MQANLPCVNFWEVILAEHRNKTHRKSAKEKKTHREESGMLQSGGQPPTIAVAKRFKSPLKSLLVAAKEADFLTPMIFSAVFVLGAQQVHRQGRHNRSRPEVGCEHGENHRFGERDEQKLRDPG